MIKRHWPYFFTLILLVLVSYGNALNNAFLSDDLAEIVQNPNIGSFQNITSHAVGFIRPVFYWLAFHIGGLNPVIFRSINLFFHAGSVFLIYILLNHLYSKKIAFFTAAIFAVHPAISEAVVWISGGSYPQYAFFFLLSLTTYIFSKNNSRFYWISVIAFLATFMSHQQMPLALFMVFLLWELCFGSLKKNWLKSIPFLMITVAYIFVTFSALPERETTLQSTHYQQSGVDNPFLLVPIAVSSYFELIIYPKILTLYHSELNFTQFNFLLRILITIIFFAFLIFGFLKKKVVFFWGSFFLIALAPTLTPFRLNWIVAERYIYLPVLGILVLTVIGLDKLISLPKMKSLSLVFFILIILILSIRTNIRNIDWKNEDNLWIATGKTSPSSPNNHNNLGDVYGRWGDKQRALQEFQTAIQLKPNYGDAYHNLANTFVELGEIDKALENYQNALKYNPKLWQSYQNIAALYFGQKQYNPALENIQKAININPKNLNLHFNLGVIYLAGGEKSKAKEIFSSILAVDPKNQQVKQALLEANK